MNEVESAIQALLREVKVGRRGWRRVASARIRAEVLARWGQWKKAEEEAAASERARAARTAREALLNGYNASATVEFDEPHGSSYFGSGGAYAAKPVVENVEVAQWGDDGFVRGPIAWRVVDPTKPAFISLSGGDCIGEEGRSWTEGARWTPGVGWHQCRGVRGL